MTCNPVNSHYRNDKTLAVLPHVSHDQPWPNITPKQSAYAHNHPTMAHT